MKTKQEIFGFVFKEGISSFDSSNGQDDANLPTEAEVVRRWMYAFDENLKNMGNGDPSKVSSVPKPVFNRIIREIVEEIIDIWKENSTKAVRSNLEVFSRVKNLVTSRISSISKSPTKNEISQE